MTAGEAQRRNDAESDAERGLEKKALLQKGSSRGYGVPGPIDGKALGTNGEELEESDDLCPSSARYYPFLDATRICCVALVAVDHGNAEYGFWNSLLCQNWCLQYLFLVCGVCYGMTKRSLLGYESRLAFYAFLGICINWSAWLLMGLDWKSNFFNVVFHIWFVFGIMLYSIILYPLRLYLESVRAQSDSQGYILSSDGERDSKREGAPGRDDGDRAEKTITVPRRARDRDSLLWSVAVIFGGFLGLLVLFHVVVQPLLSLAAPLVLRLFSLFGTGLAFWGLPEDTAETYAFLQRVCEYTTVSCTNIYLIVACTKMFKRRQLAPWIVICNTYVHRLLFYRAADERAYHGLDLMTIALAIYYLGLLHRRKLGEYVVRYWIVLLAATMLIWPLGTYGRFDETPPVEVGMRIRYNSLEAICVVCWFLAADRIVDKRIFTEDNMDFMNDWALLTFLVHKAVHIMFPQPWNWIVIAALVPVCYVRRHYT